MSDSERLVQIHPGLVVRVAALLLLDLEDRGFRLSVTHDGALCVGPRGRLTPDDSAAIRQHRYYLVALVRHCEAVR
jgi:hypothetical protein